MEEKGPDSAKNKVTIYNKFSPNFRELHVDGAYGGMTPRGLLNINFYAERAPIPRSTEFTVEGANLIDPQHSADSKKGIIREFEVGIYMDVNAARELNKWLTTHIANIEKNIMV
jgi:hypothetical protein